MTIDIISYTDEQYKALTAVQLVKVQRAQLKKNRLAEKLAENLQKERDNLIEHGTFNSSLYSQTKIKLQEEYDEEVEFIKNELIAYLFESEDTAENDSAGSSYVVDYDLTYDERFDIVKAYYMDTYTDATARLNAFADDEVAMRYLGEYYEPLYDYFLALAS